MKKIILFSVLAFLLGGCNNSTNRDGQTSTSADTTKFHAIDTMQLTKGSIFYQCPMHHEVTSDKPGSCPKCGMELEKVEKQ